MDLDRIDAERLLNTLLRTGGDYADIFYEEHSRTAIVLEDKKIDSLSSGIESGLALRLIAQQKSALAFANQTSKASLLEMARDLARFAESRLSRQICLDQRSREKLFPISISPESVPIKDKLALLKNGERLAWCLSPKIVQVHLSYSDSIRKTEIINSEGAWLPSRRVLTHASVTITTSDGENYFTGYDSSGGHLGFEALSEEIIAGLVRNAGRRALLNLSADRARGGTMPVIIAADAGGTLVHEAVGHGLEADLACNNLSVYKDLIGQKIASEKITIVDDPTLVGKRGSFAVDDEGIIPAKTILIEKGVLKDFMYDRLTALKMGRKSNGHGRRESYQSKPIVRMSNTIMESGQDDTQAIIKSLDSGLYVAMMGGGEVNTVNGDFMFEVVEGYRIEHGQIGAPVRGATLTGNGPKILQEIDQVGSDLGFSTGTCGKDGQDAPVTDAMPTIRIPSMVVGGATA